MNNSIKVNPHKQNVLLIGAEPGTRLGERMLNALSRVGIDEVFIIPGLDSVVYLEKDIQ